jgi:NitT/TauT family transport system permease protein
MTVQSETAVDGVRPNARLDPNLQRQGAPFWRPVSGRLASPLFAAALIAYWEIHVRVFKVDPLLLPPPSQIALSFWHGMTSGLFLSHFATTIFRALSGFAVATLCGVTLGALMCWFRIVEQTIYPWVVALQTVPKIAIAPLILVWCGYGSLSKIVTAALVAFFPVLVNTIVGLRSCEQGKLDLMRSLKASRWQTFRMVELPNALPFIFAGLSIAVVFSILGALVGEFVGSKDGIGFLILDANYQLNIARVFALLILLALYGIGCHLLLQFAHRRLVFWNEPRSVTSA